MKVSKIRQTTLYDINFSKGFEHILRVGHGVFWYTIGD